MSSLQEAYEALDNGDTRTAQAIAADLLKSDQGNAEAWFILSEAVTGDRKLVFLKKAVKLDPTLDAVQARLAEAEGRPWPEPEPEPITEFPDTDFDAFDPIAPAEDNLQTEMTAVEELIEEPVEKQVEEVVAAEDAPSTKPTPVFEEEAIFPPREEKETALQPTPATQTDKANEPAPPSQLVNTAGFIISLALFLIMFYLFVASFS